ncbi:thyroid receptor-interacting protein 11 isoform X2 [Drosophila busckii]|uniref:thyroid receptor-interacting protein 11 isoform X2 n=1 Tax=Drosophila busckii TaxID=30019 RepID=UPI00083F43C7|nr:thyroid receptor-interacting protein 11 isoform X2 [Drosophila busckii]
MADCLSSDIVALRKQITTLRSQQISKVDGAVADGVGDVADSETKSLATAQNVEDSWCWEPDAAAASTSSKSTTPPTLVDVALDGADVSKLNGIIAELEQQNAELRDSLEQLDAQHEQVMEDVLGRKAQLQQQLAGLKQTQADRLVEHELAMARLQKQLASEQQAQQSASEAREQLQQRVEQQAQELQRSVLELADMQQLLEKRGADNGELIERVRQAEAERDELAKQMKGKKTSESSNSSSTGKHSEDEFIVVRNADSEPDADAATTPPSKEKLRDKLVALEARIAELTAANQKQQEAEQAVQLSSSGLKEQLSELEQRLRISESEKEQLQLELQRKLQQLMLQNQELKLSAEADQETHANDLEQQLGALRAQNLLLRQELDANIAQAKFRQAIAEEKQEITDLDVDLDENELRTLLEKLRADSSEQTLERVYQQLNERWTRLELSEQRLSELQDQQLIVEHEKKTLEADISQYILQCDELMKNNELLLNELDKFKRNKLETIEEHHEQTIMQLELQLEEARQQLKQAAGQEAPSSGELQRIEQLLREVQMLQEEKCELEAQMEQLRLQLEERDVRKTVAQQLESQQAEQLQSKKQCIDELEQQAVQAKESSAQLQLELQQVREQLQTSSANETEQQKQLQQQKQQLAKQQAQLKQCKEQLDKLNAQLQEHAALEMQVKQLKQELQGSEQQHIAEESQVKQLQQQLQNKEQHIAELSLKLHEHETLMQQKEQSEQRIEELLLKLKAQSAQPQPEMKQLKTQLHEKEQRIEELNMALKDYGKQHKSNLLELLMELKQLKETRPNQPQIEQLEAQLAEKEQRMEELNTQLTEHAEQVAQIQQQKEQRIAELELELQQLKETQTTASQPQTEQCQAQLQEQTLRVEEQTIELQQLQAELSAVKQQLAEQQTQLEQLNAEKLELIKAVQQKHAENTQYYAEIQRLQPLETHLAELLKEREQLRDQITFLKEKSDILTTNLLTEQSNQRLLQQQQSESQDQQLNVQKDLERLRAHLLEVEELHTQETVELQRELEDSRIKLAALQQEVSKSSTAYTSASIRANQQAETLQAQHALLLQQRDELLAKLGQHDDRELKQQAALTNLQCALEQFQNDKEHDIQSATQRMRRELQLQQEKQAALQTEMAAQQQQLAEANQGLRAAARLSDQLDAGQQTIAVLRDEVDSLKELNGKLEQRLSSSESSQTDKIDKSLIKSLLIGYVVSGHAGDKQQVLRMISSVLDFSSQESDRVGLNKQQSSWLGAILGGGAGTTGGNENLVQAFVQFLEQESQPQPAARPNLLNMGKQSDAASAATTATIGATTAANSSDHQAMSPASMTMNNSNEFTPTRNSSSILKDILSDS